VNLGTGLSYEAAVGAVRKAAPHARELRALGRIAGADHHGVWLDRQLGQVYHAWTTSEADGAWEVDQESAAEALGWVVEAMRGVLAALANPNLYRGVADARGRAERDLEAFNDYAAVELASLQAAARRDGALGAEEVVVVTDRALRTRMDVLRAQLAVFRVLRSENIASEFGRAHGAGAAAARVLDGNGQATNRVLGAWEEYAERVRARVAELSVEGT
jgi:hypothetical protein